MGNGASLAVICPRLVGIHGKGKSGTKESELVAENYHRQRVLMLQEDFCVIVGNNTPVDQFPVGSDA